jgi:hypothetical protein
MSSFYNNWDPKDTKNTKKKQMSIKNTTVIIKAQKAQKKNSPIFEKQLASGYLFHQPLISG